LPIFQVNYTPESGQRPEHIEADTVTVEAGSQIVLRRTVVVIGQAREIVVCRLSGSQVISVEPI
jgi:hypothetical protein